MAMEMWKHGDMTGWRGIGHLGADSSRMMRLMAF
jgi:hypothetical protein